MTWRRVGSSLNVIAIAIGLASCSGGDSTGPGGSFGVGTGPFVTTGGASNEITFIVDLFTNRMSFNAKGDPAAANGEFNFQGVISGVNSHVHGDVICYGISPDGKSAHVAGRVTNSDLFEPGTEMVWGVRDNGEGSGTPDEVTNLRTAGFTIPGPIEPMVITAQAYCNPGLSFVEVMFPTQTGNVQVHP